MEIVFTQKEISILAIWGESYTASGHWGGQVVYFPGEQELLKIISELKADQPFLLKQWMKDILLAWVEVSTRTPEEIGLENKLFSL